MANTSEVKLNYIGIAICGNKKQINKLTGNMPLLRQEEKWFMRTEWVHCPVCGAKTRDRIGEDTILKNYPLYCPKCKQETLIEAKKFQVTVIRKENT